MDNAHTHLRDRLTSALNRLEQRASAVNEAEIRYLHARDRLTLAEDAVLLGEEPNGKNAEQRAAQVRSRTYAERREALEADTHLRVTKRHYEVARDAVKVALALAGLGREE